MTIEPEAVTTALSMEAWVKPTTLVGYQTYMRRGNCYFIRQADDNFQAYFGFGGTGVLLQGGKIPAAGVWTHVAATYDGDKMIRLYVNGALVLSQVETRGLVFDASPHVMGAMGSGGGEVFIGSLDEVATYNNALKPEVIAAHHAAGPSTPAILGAKRSLTGTAAGTSTADAFFRDAYQTAVLSTPGLVGYWRLSESAGLLRAGGQAADASGNSRHGTYNGSPQLGEPGAIEVVAPNESAFKGNGTDAYMLSNVPTTNVFSVEVWAKSVTTTWGKDGWISSARVPNGWVIHPNSGTTGLGFWILDSATGYNLLQSGCTVPDPQNWHHFVLTWDGTTGRGYVDGVQMNVATPAITRTSGGTTPVYWGYDYNLAGRFTDGWLDEAAVYNVALAPETVFQHYVAAFPKIDVQGTSAGKATANAVLDNPRWKALSVSATYPPQGSGMTVGLIGSDRTLQRPIYVRQVASAEAFDVLEVNVPIAPMAPNALLYVLMKYGSVPGHTSVGTPTIQLPELRKFGVFAWSVSLRYSTGTGTAIPNDAGVRGYASRLGTAVNTQGAGLIVRVWVTGATNIGWLRAEVLEIHGTRGAAGEFGLTDAYYSTSNQALTPYWSPFSTVSDVGMFIAAAVARTTAPGTTFTQVGMPGTPIRLAENTDGSTRLPHVTDLLVNQAAIAAARPSMQSKWNLPTSINWGAFSDHIRGPTPTLAGRANGVGWAPDFTRHADGAFRHNFLFGTTNGVATCVGLVTSRRRPTTLGGPAPETFTTDGVLTAPWAWIGTPGVQSIAAGTLNLGAQASTVNAFSGIQTTTIYDVLNKVIMAEIVSRASVGATTMLRIDGGGTYWMEFGQRADGQLAAQYWTGGISTWTNIAWPAGLRAVRMVFDYPNAPGSYSSGRILFEYTIDGVRWITLGQMTPEYVWAGLTATRIALRTDANSIASPGLAQFDNFNVVPFPWVPYKSMTALSAGQAGMPSAAFVPFVHDFQGFSNGKATTTVTEISGSRPTDDYGLAVYSHPNLVAYWRLGEKTGVTAMDISPTGRHHGTYVGNPVLGAPTALSSGADSSVDFDGVNDYVDIPDFVVGTSGSVEAWFRADAWTVTTNLVSRRNTSNVGGFTLEVAPGGVPYFHLHNGTTWTGIMGTRTLATGVWHHLCAMWAPGGSSLLMVNGEDVGRASFAGGMNNPAGALFRIGYHVSGAVADGQIDEVALYNTPIPDQTARDHYVLGVKGRDLYQRTIHETSGLVGYWPFNEPVRGNSFDYSGRGQNFAHGTGLTTTQPTQGIVGAPYRSLHFNATLEAKATRPIVDPALNFGAGPFSMEFWTYQDTTTTATAGCILEYGDAVNWGFHVFNWDPSTPQNLWVNFGAGMPAPGGINSGNFLTPAVWHHVVILRGADNIARAYIDGVQRGPDYAAAGVIGTNYPLNIGWRPSPGPGGGYAHTGYLDQIAFYNRALTPAEIASHYTIGRTPSLVGSAVGTATATARAPKRLPLMIFYDDFEDNNITPDKWDIWASGLSVEQSARPWGRR